MAMNRLVLIAMLLFGLSCMAFMPAAAFAQRGESPVATDGRAVALPQDEPAVKTPKIELKVFSIDLKSHLGMDHTGKVTDLLARMEIGFGLRFPDAENHFIAYEDVTLDQVVTSAGEKLAPAPSPRRGGDPMWEKFYKDRKKAAHHFFFRQTPLPLKPASQISKITGHVHLELGLGELKEQTIKEFSDAKSRRMILKEFPDKPIEFTRNMRNDGLEMVIDPSLDNHLLYVFFYDENGKQIKVGGMYGSGKKDGKPVRVITLSLPQKGSIKVLYYPKFQKYRWAFEINNVPMPQSVRLDSQHIVNVELKPVSQEPVGDEAAENN